MCPYQRVHLGHRGFAHGYFWVKGLVWPLLWATFSSAIGDSSLCCRSPHRRSTVDSEHIAPPFPLFSTLPHNIGWLCQALQRLGTAKENVTRGATLKTVYSGIYSHQDLQANAHSRFLCNKQQLETTQMSVNRQMDKQTLVYPYRKKKNELNVHPKPQMNLK